MSIKSKNIAVKADNNIVFNVVIIEQGDTYGLNNALVHKDKIPLVEFYDSRYDFSEHGQFIARYNCDTILNSNSGLNLMGHEPAWSIDSGSMNIIRNFIKNNEALVNIELPQKLKF